MARKGFGLGRADVAVEADAVAAVQDTVVRARVPLRARARTTARARGGLADREAGRDDLQHGLLRHVGEEEAHGVVPVGQAAQQDGLGAGKADAECAVLNTDSVCVSRTRGG